MDIGYCDSPSSIASIFPESPGIGPRAFKLVKGNACALVKAFRERLHVGLFPEVGTNRIPPFCLLIVCEVGNLVIC